jgi:hypothetical protein
MEIIFDIRVFAKLFFEFPVSPDSRAKQHHGKPEKTPFKPFYGLPKLNFQKYNLISVGKSRGTGFQSIPNLT